MIAALFNLYGCLKKRHRQNVNRQNLLTEAFLLDPDVVFLLTKRLFVDPGFSQHAGRRDNGIALKRQNQTHSVSQFRSHSCQRTQFMHPAKAVSFMDRESWNQMLLNEVV